VARLYLFVVMIAAALSSGCGPMPGGSTTYYVKDSVLDVRLAPSPAGTITNRIYRQQKVEVFEINSEWARVSNFYDGAVEGKTGRVARWVLAAGLSSSQVVDLPQPTISQDPRIEKNAFPKVGQNGLTAYDVQLLNKGALKFLSSGKCRRVEYGDKSLNKANTYFVNCGSQNLFFTPSDL
jgi:hypothetical protein